MFVRNFPGLAGRQALGHAHGVLQNNAGRDTRYAKTAILAVHIAMVHILTVRSLTAGACTRAMISMFTDGKGLLWCAVGHTSRRAQTDGYDHHYHGGSKTYEPITGHRHSIDHFNLFLLI
jgi:hypothetical protein